MSPSNKDSKDKGRLHKGEAKGNENATIITHEMIREINRNSIVAVLNKLTSFPTRHMETTDGRKAQLYVVEKAEEYLGTKMEEIPPSKTMEYPIDYPLQRNVTVIIPGVVHPNKVVIIGAHLDTIREGQDKHAKAPGYDDNGSGVSVVLECLRIISLSGRRFKNTLHFVTFRGEEIGLIGSKELAKKYVQDKKEVIGFLNIDSVSYWPYRTKKIGLVYDNSTKETIEIVESIIKAFTPLSPARKMCRYHCGDSASFKQLGLNCCMIESYAENKHHHSDKDTFKTAPNGILLMEETVKIALGFLVKLGEPIV